MASSAYAKKAKDGKGEWKTGKILYTNLIMASGLDGVPESDRYYSGDYICVGGDDHHAPTCRTRHEWSYEKSPAQASLRLEDGTVITIIETPTASNIGPLGAFMDMLTTWEDNYLSSEAPGGTEIPAEGTFRYRLGNFHKDTGLQDVMVEMHDTTPSTLRARVVFPFLGDQVAAGAYIPNGLNVVK
jgi:hypothetical protein